jgi:transcriptional regulator with XRE-family HTH domain
LALARAAGLTQATISNYESGKRDIPVPSLVRIIAALDVPLGALVDTVDIIVARDSKLGRAVAELAGDPAN